MVGGGPFSLPAGAWTDDTSMALCLAESLVERADVRPRRSARRYVRWYRDGHWSSTGSCFDIGNATRAALERFERTGEPFPGDAAPDAAGNGPLMKLAPVVLAYASRPADALRFAGESARTTHGAPEAVDASRAFAALGCVGRPEPTTEPRAPSTSLHPEGRRGPLLHARAAGRARRRVRRRRARGGAVGAAHHDELRGRRARRGQPRRRRGHDRRDLRPARGRDLRARRDPRAGGGSACIATTRSSRSPTRCSTWTRRRPALARFEHIRPAVVARCASPRDVAEALARARRDGLPVAVRSGGHDFAGRSSTTGAADRHAPAATRSRSATDTVTVGAGARLGEIYDALAPHGRTIAAGCGPTVGHRGARARRRDRPPRAHARVHVRPGRSEPRSSCTTARSGAPTTSSCGRSRARAARASASSPSSR